MMASVETLHVLPAGDVWVIENECGMSFARETGRVRALERAKEIGRVRGIRFIVVHRRSGALDEIAVPLVWEMTSDERLITQEVREEKIDFGAAIEQCGTTVPH